jgi:hypothetical protein
MIHKRYHEEVRDLIVPSLSQLDVFWEVGAEADADAHGEGDGDGGEGEEAGDAEDVSASGHFFRLHIPSFIVHEDGDQGTESAQGHKAQHEPLSVGMASSNVVDGGGGLLDRENSDVGHEDADGQGAGQVLPGVVGDDLVTDAEDSLKSDAASLAIAYPAKMWPARSNGYETI